ncbi:MAG: NAD-dependent epimerase/dehydratase family protein [bacterium]|nr:NAD-dependent epimerase/dehydratase family protein [bacterium]
MNKVKVVVTGGAGFIGSHIVDTLVSEGNEVHIVDNLSAGKKENINPNAILHVVDIRDAGKIVSIFKDAEYVFHQAAFPQVQYSIENPAETHEINVNGTLNVLEACRINKVKRLIFASSSAVYGDQEVLPTNEDGDIKPLSPYGAQKYIGEAYCKLYSQIYNLETVCLRYFNVYGPRQSPTGAYASVISKFIDSKKNNQPLLITGDGEQTRDFVNVLDVAVANILAMKSEKVGRGEAINIGSGIQYSVRYLAGIVAGDVQYVTARVEPKNTLADVSKARGLLYWEPSIKLSEALKELISLK